MITNINDAMKNNITPADFQKSGIYIITNTVNDKMYIGSGVVLIRRYKAHVSTLTRGCHRNPHLTAFYKQHGLGVLEFSVLELCTPEEIADRETFYLNKYEAYKKGFNIIHAGGTPGSLGRVTSEETKRKIGAANSGRKWTEEQKQKLKEARKGRVMTKKQIDALLTHGQATRFIKGHKQTVEQIEQGAQKRRGLKQRPETIQKRAQRQVGRKMSEQAKKNISEAAKARRARGA